jgi:TPR repeat protein
MAAMQFTRIALAAGIAFALLACNELDRTRWSARLGSAEAQLALGERLAAGDGVEKDLDEALVWLEKAAEDGSVPAQMRLVALYGERGAPEDAARAEHWLRAAAEAGDGRAQAELAERILAAGGDDAEAAKWIARSAEAGDPRGLVAQAQRLAREPGNDAEVLALLTRAAEQGDPDAAYELARVGAASANVEVEALS